MPDKVLSHSATLVKMSGGDGPKEPRPFCPQAAAPPGANIGRMGQRVEVRDPWNSTSAHSLPESSTGFVSSRLLAASTHCLCHANPSPIKTAQPVGHRTGVLFAIFRKVISRDTDFYKRVRCLKAPQLERARYAHPSAQASHTGADPGGLAQWRALFQRAKAGSGNPASPV